MPRDKIGSFTWRCVLAATLVPGRESVGQSFSLAKEITFSYPGAPILAMPVSHGGAGDWSGDGVPDFAVRYGSYLSTPGVLRIHSGFDFGLVQEWTGTLQYYLPPGPPIGSVPENPGAGLAFADVDGDGQEEALIGTPTTFLGSQYFVGKVDAVSPASGVTLYTVWGQGAYQYFGADVIDVGDTSGNGVPDYLVYAGFSESFFLIEGADGSVRGSLSPTYVCEFCGVGRAGVGDVDGDGLADFAIARSSWNMGTGKVTVYSGLSVTGVIREHVGTQPSWSYGNGVVLNLGDADADLVPDYVVGALSWGGGGPGAAPGQAWLYSGATGAQITTYVGPPGTTGLGSYGDTLGDIDGDGVNDLALSASTAVPGLGYTNVGQVLAFSGLSGGVLQVIQNPATGCAPGGFCGPFGAWLSNAGDIDGDGRADFTCGRGQPSPLFIFTHDIVTLAPNPVPIGSTALFTFSLPAQPGSPFHLLLATSADTGIPIGTRTFPLDLGPLLLDSLLNPSFGGVLDASGYGTVSVPVPLNPALSGLSLEFAGVTLSPTAPFGVRTIGTAKSVTIQ